MMPVHIALYGKGGTGKTTVAATVSAALAERGLKVVLIGCGPRSDTGRLLGAETEHATVLDLLQRKGGVRIGDVAARGFNGVTCVELGDVFAAGDCASRGIGDTVALLRESGVTGDTEADVVLYDVPGEILCGGLATPIRMPLVQRVFVVTSSDYVSLYTANCIFQSIARFAPHGGAKLGGIIANGLTTAFAESFVADFAARTGARVVSVLPRSLTVIHAELYGKTVIEAAPESNHAVLCRRLAATIAEDTGATVPVPLEPPELRRWARQWGDHIRELETGIVFSPGAGI
jgi:nitrogenase iron protein NifH